MKICLEINQLSQSFSPPFLERGDIQYIWTMNNFFVSVLLSTLAAQFPGACGVKFRNPETRVSLLSVGWNKKEKENHSCYTQVSSLYS